MKITKPLSPKDALRFLGLIFLVGFAITRLNGCYQEAQAATATEIHWPHLEMECTPPNAAPFRVTLDDNNVARLWEAGKPPQALVPVIYEDHAVNLTAVSIQQPQANGLFQMIDIVFDTLRRPYKSDYSSIEWIFDTHKVPSDTVDIGNPTREVRCAMDWEKTH